MPEPQPTVHSTATVSTAPAEPVYSVSSAGSTSLGTGAPAGAAPAMQGSSSGAAGSSPSPGAGSSGPRGFPFPSLGGGPTPNPAQPYFWTALPASIAAPARRSFTPWIVGVVLLCVLYLFRDALTLAFVAFALAYVAAPAVRRVERAGLPRGLAITAVLLGFVGLLAAMVAVLVPELLRQAQSLLQSIPDYSRAIQQQWIPWARNTLHMRLPPRTEDALAQLGLRASAIAPRLGGLLNDTLSYTVIIVEAIFTVLIVSATSFYMLLDFDGLMQRTAELVPHSARSRVYALAREVDDTLRHFVNGQLLVMVILGALYALGLGLLGVPAGWAIGVFAGLISFVPYLGFFVALGLALVMTALAGRGPAGLLAVTGVMTAVHLLDLTLVTPRILGGRAKVSPVVVILALVAGGSVFGFTGVLVAIPVASVLRVLLSHAVEVYKGTGFFLDGAPQPDALTSAPFSDVAPGRVSDPPGDLREIPPVTLDGPVTLAGTTRTLEDTAKTLEQPRER